MPMKEGWQMDRALPVFIPDHRKDDYPEPMSDTEWVGFVPEGFTPQEVIAGKAKDWDQPKAAKKKG